MKLRSRTLVCLMLSIVVLFLLLSCRKKTDTSDGDSRSDAVATADTSGLITVRFRPQWLHQAQFAGVYVAHAKGIYRDYGLNVIIQDGGPDYPAAKSLRDGDSEFVSLFLLTAMAQADEGLRLVNVAQVSQRSSFMIAAKQSSGIREPKDLNGRKVGLWYSDFREIALLFLQKNNVEAEIIPVDWTINLLLSDAIDALNVMRYNEYHQLMQAGLDPEEMTVFEMADHGLNIPEDGIYCTREFYNFNPKLARDFGEATMDGWLYAINNPEEALDIVMDIMRRSHIPANRPHQRWMLNVQRDVILARPEMVGKLEESVFNTAKGMLIDHAGMKVPVSFREFVANAVD